MEIRKAKIEDNDRVFELLNELYENKMNYNVFSEIYKEKINDKGSYYICAVEDEKIVGILISEISVKLHRAKKQSFIENLIIDKNYRSRGIGKLLLQDAIEYARNQDCEVIELTSRILNENAHRFYENNNFEKHAYKFKKYLNKY